ncbi:hypothetical protein HHK36_023387 [Tetracentron sinense]|uniref:CST complex subunit STN1 n=1 Tax=Tetracentron sinense TaxID=13715 RepID=A0A834YS97_TETSI|nr:hypothetical protein HHK36_023387 [Tetracentron sinense]
MDPMYSSHASLKSRNTRSGSDRELKDKFLKFLVDDGTEMVANHASEIKLGVLARVCSRITTYGGALQITVSNVVEERDLNAQILHWLDCVKLTQNCYDVGPHQRH